LRYYAGVLVRARAHVFALLLAVAFGCGDGGGPTSDGGLEQYTLEVLDPPGDAIGLAFNQTVELRARYLDGTGMPLRNRPVEFSILASASESVGGSALSATSANTDRDGIAVVELIAGAQGAGFRVAATAANASQATFYVTVSDQGFTRLLIEPVHDGPRPAIGFSSVEVRLYRPDELRCASADPDALPESLFAPRSLPSYGEIAKLPNLAANAPYTAVAWAQIAPSTTPLAFGCVELGASQARNGDVSLPLVTRDRPVVMDQPLILESTFELDPLVAASASDQAPWNVLACPNGPGQLVVDCVADALVSDGALDCNFQGNSAVADDIRAARGAVDGSGCRPAQLAGGGDSLDGTMMQAIALGGTFPTDAELDELLTIRADLASRLVLRSRLYIEGSAARHTLSEAELGPPPSFVVDLVATTRPVLEQTQIATAVAPIGSSSPTATLAEHGFTLDHGALARDAFAALALDAAGLDGTALGTALTGSAKTTPSSACAAVSEVLCAATALPSTCAQAACAAAGAELDTRLQGWWLFTHGSGVDLALQGTLVLSDDDDDLLVDRLGRNASGEITGAWSASFTTANGEVTTTAKAASP